VGSRIARQPICCRPQLVEKHQVCCAKPTFPGGVGGMFPAMVLDRLLCCAKHFPGGLRESTDGTRVAENSHSEALGWGAQ